MKTKKILIVVTSNDRLGDTGKRTGYYLPEVSHPVARFAEAGFAVDFASPAGGEAPVDPGSVNRSDPDSRALLDDPTRAAALRSTLRVDAVDPAAYDAVFFAGGMGVMWDFADHAATGALAARVFERGGVVAAVCHGPAALLSARLADGTPLVAGHEVSAFSNAEEAAAGHLGFLPYLLETALVERGARYASAPLWQAKVVASGRLVTGQNPASARGVADAVVGLLAGVA